MTYILFASYIRENQHNGLSEDGGFLRMVTKSQSMQTCHSMFPVIRSFLSLRVDGIGRDITPAMKVVVDAAVLKAYGG